MHICLITPSFPPMVDGGVAIATGRLVARLVARGHQVTVFTAPPAGRSTVNDGDTAGAGMTLHHRFVEEPLRAPQAVITWLDFVKEKHYQKTFDVILGYFVYPGGYLATVVGGRLGVPVVCSCRGNDLSKDVFIDPATIATVLQGSTRLIFVSDSLFRMADTLVRCADKATVIANAVDEALFVPRGVDTRGTSHVVLGTSSILRWKKGLDLLLPVVDRLCTTHQTVRILLAGYGLDTVIEQQIADFLQQPHMQERVEMTGPLPHGQMPPALQQMDIYLNTSYQEGMPNGVLEAMACGLPVVATDADGTPRLVEHGVTGYLCRRGDLDAFVEHCSDLITQPALRQRFGAAGRVRVQQHFQPEQEAAAVEAVLYQAWHSAAPAFQERGSHADLPA